MESNDRIQDPLLAPIHLVSKFTKREEIIEHMNAAIAMHLQQKKNIILLFLLINFVILELILVLLCDNNFKVV